MSTTKIIHLNLFSKPVTIFICKIKNIKCQNIKEIIPTLNCSLINPKLICSYDQLTAALTRAVNNYLCGSMKTRSPYTEILYSLSPSTNVTESLKTFGVSEDGTTALAVRIISETLNDSLSFENDLKTALNCEFDSFDFLDCDLEAVNQIYKPTSIDSKDRIIGEICTTIATKNI